jgi:hypothetical protein
MSAIERPRPRLSIVVVVFEMERQAWRTLRSLATPYQRGVDATDYEVIVVDNGSARPFHGGDLSELGPGFRYHRVEDAPPSPARALNLGAQLAAADYLGFMIDGARMLTPGILRLALAARALSPRPYVVTHNFDLLRGWPPLVRDDGSDAVPHEALLTRINWPADGYLLFDVGILEPESWVAPMNESCLFFVERSSLAAVGGFDEAFASPGGGMLGIRMHERLCAAEELDLVTLLGEATFHQQHGGVCTDAPRSALAQLAERMRAEYRTVVGREWWGEPPSRRSRFLGRLSPAARRWQVYRAQELIADLPEQRRETRAAQRAATQLRLELLRLQGVLAEETATLSWLRAEIARRAAEATRLRREVAARRSTLENAAQTARHDVRRRSGPRPSAPR